MAKKQTKKAGAKVAPAKKKSNKKAAPAKKAAKKKVKDEEEDEEETTSSKKKGKTKSGYEPDDEDNAEEEESADDEEMEEDEEEKPSKKKGKVESSRKVKLPAGVSNPEKTYRQIKDLVELMDEDFDRFLVNETRAAGRRLRGYLQQVKKNCQTLRKEIQLLQNERKVQTRKGKK
jgi:hypothetical protein